MAAKKSLDVRLRKWHVSEEATIDHLVRSLAPEEPRKGNELVGEDTDESYERVRLAKVALIQKALEEARRGKGLFGIKDAN